MKAWITKYALTVGIIEVDGEVSNSDSETISYETNNDGYTRTNCVYGKGKEWHLLKDNAIERAKEMRLKKIASLKKQIKKLENMTF